jgi:hypothetical protein
MGSVNWYDAPSGSLNSLTNDKVNRSGDTMSGSLDMGGFSIVGLADLVSGSLTSSATNKLYVDSLVSSAIAGLDGRVSKTFASVSAPAAADSALAVGTNLTGEMPDFTGVSNEDFAALYDVFMNGQLLRAGAGMDVYLDGGSLKLTFDAVANDVICIFKYYKNAGEIGTGGGGGGGGTVMSVTADGPLSSSGGTDPVISLSGSVPVANGGTGLTATPTNGQVLIGNGSGYTLSTITAGTNVSISSSAGSITINAGGGTPLFASGSVMVYVDPVNGVDAADKGTISAPFQTINYAYSQVPSLGNASNATYNSNVGKYITEKLIFNLAPGRYTENVTLGFKRARVALVGNGVQIVGNVKMSVVRADFPASSMEALKASFPSPWTSASSQNTFEIVGVNGAGVESDASSDSIVITGVSSMAFEEPTMPGSGLGTNWDANYGQFYFYANKANLMGGMVMATNYTVPTTNGMVAAVMEIDSCTVGEASSPIRTYLGVVPYAYLANAATWSSATNGTTNKAPTGTITLKMHNTTAGAALGPRLVIGEIDGCRIYDIDRTMLGTVDNGSITGSTSTSYIGMVSNQFRVYSGTGIPASQYQIGAATGTTRYKLDSVSYTTLAFSRNSSGVLSARTLNVGGGVSYDFLDEARSLAYTPTTSANWTAPAPTTVQAALDRMAARIVALGGGASIP